MLPGFLAVLTILIAAASSDVNPDRDLGLVKTSVFDTPVPPAVHENATDPGDEPILPRAYAGAPPRIPHGIADFTPITRDDNACLDCHLVEEKVEGEPTPVPESHFRDLRRAPEEIRPEIAGARYVCTTCHVPVTDAQALVGNGFGGGEDER